MNKPNSIEFKIWGRYALFSDPINRVGGEKFTYQVPTYQALKGIGESIYWKPTLIWYIDELRVMNRIITQSQGIRPISYNPEPNTLSIYTYLYNVEYRIKAHFEWNMQRPELKEDRNENKHYIIAKRMLERGGRRDIFLGTRECQGYVVPCGMKEGEGYYDNYGDLSFGLMFHGFDYPDETGRDMPTARFCEYKMKNGYITFNRPEECSIKRDIREMKAKAFGIGNFTGFKEFEEVEGFELV